MKSILILDSAMNGCVCAVYDLEAHQCYSEVFSGARGQAEVLVPMAQKAVEAAGLSFDALDAVVVTVGPGAFTGIRIGMSAAKAFAVSLDIPVYGVSTLQALALDYTEGHETAVRVVLETKREDFYVQAFDECGRSLDDACSMMGDLIPLDLPVIGDALERFQKACVGEISFADGYDQINPEVLGRVFADEHRREAFFIQDVQPIYLRGPDVSKPKNPPRVLS